MRRQSSVGRLVRQIVANMSEERALGLHPLHDAQRILHRRMCGMRLMSQRIQKENIQSFELTQRRLGNFAVVGQVCSASEAEAINLRVAVYDPHRFEARSEKIYRTVNRAQLELRQAAIFVIRVEDVAE